MDKKNPSWRAKHMSSQILLSLPVNPRHTPCFLYADRVPNDNSCLLGVVHFIKLFIKNVKTYSNTTGPRVKINVAFRLLAAHLRKHFLLFLPNEWCIIFVFNPFMNPIGLWDTSSFLFFWIKVYSCESILALHSA